jgi:hypothetical protein
LYLQTGRFLIEDNMSFVGFPTTLRYSNENQVSTQESLSMSVEGQAITIRSKPNITNTDEEQIHENNQTENLNIEKESK